MGPLVIPLIQAGAMIASQLGQNAAQRRAQDRADARNRGMTDVAYQRELELMKYQNDYNSPLNQMQRFKDAGLNPNLVYGQGSPGNMLSKPSVPQQAPSRAPQISFQAPDLSGLLLQQSQRSLTETKTEESTVKQDLMRIQQQVAAANPYLSPGYLDAVVSQMISVADMKKQERDFKLMEIGGTYKGIDLLKPEQRGVLIMEKQMDDLFQKYDIDTKKSDNLDLDKKIKAQVIMSKQFQNDLQEIQRNWMRDGEITPQHILQAIFILLQKIN